MQSEALHPAESVIVTQCVPAHNPVAVAVVWASGSSHIYIYGGIPPIIAPVACPSQIENPEALLSTVATATAGGKSLTTAGAVPVQLLASVITTL
jgi:hypothetical protein